MSDFLIAGLIPWKSARFKFAELFMTSGLVIRVFPELAKANGFDFESLTSDAVVSPLVIEQENDSAIVASDYICDANETTKVLDKNSTVVINKNEITMIKIRTIAGDTFTEEPKKVTKTKAKAKSK
jgi:hypothetical protein